MHEQLENGMSFRLFIVFDDSNREDIGMKVDFFLPSERGIRELKQIISWRGKTESLFVTTGLNTSVSRYRHEQKKKELRYC